METGVETEVCVLFIEGEPLVANSVERMLVAEGDIAFYRIGDPEAAPAEAEEYNPTVIVQDIDRPDVDGIAALGAIRRQSATRGVPIVALSDRDDAQTKSRAFAQGASDYVVKPPEPTELVARIRYHSQAYLNLVERMEIEKHRSLSQMVAGVAHELNTPLGIALTAADMIAKRVASTTVSQALEKDEATRGVLAEIVEAAELMRRNIARAHTLTEQFKKVSVQQLTDVRERVHLPDLVADIVDLYGIEARRAGMEVEIHNNLEGDAEWDGYPGYLTQIVHNCLSNAERYAYAQGGRVEIRLEHGRRRAGAAPWLVLVVRDFGVGMEAEQRDRVFEPFFTTGRGSGGSGLGMAIVYNLVTAALKGVVRVDSEPQQGTAVELRFPQCTPT